MSGDSHTAWANELHRDGQRIGLEVSVSTLTGPTMGTLRRLEDVPPGSAFVRDNHDARLCDHLAVAFVAVTIGRDEVRAEFLSVTAPRKTNSRVATAHVVQADVADGQLAGWRGPIQV